MPENQRIGVDVNTQPEAQQLKRAFDWVQERQKATAKPSPTEPAGTAAGGGASWFQALRSSAQGMLRKTIETPLGGLGPPGRIVAGAAFTPVEQWGGRVKDFVSGMVWGIILDPFSELGAAGRIVTGGLMAFGRPLITAAIKAPLTLGKAGAALGGVGAAVGAAVGLVAAAAAIKFVLIPLINLGITYKILRTSYRWAEETTDAQMRVLARTRRTFPGVIGEAFETARQTTWAKLEVVSGLFGQSADAMWQGFQRRMVMAQQGRGGGAGAKDMFTNLGITPQAVRQFEEMRGGERLGLNDMLFLFIRKREQLQNQMMATAEGSAEREVLMRRQAKLMDSAVRLFGNQFADMVGAFNSHDLRQLNYALLQAAPLAAPSDAEHAEQNVTDFKIAIATVKNTFTQLKEGIVGEVQPKLTAIMENLRTWLLTVTADGETLGIKLRNLGSALAIHAWRTVTVLIESFSIDDLRPFINLMTGWNPKKDIDHLLKLGHLLKLLFTPITLLFKWAMWVVEKLKPLDKLLGGPIKRGAGLVGAAAKGLWGAGETAGVWYKAYRAAGGGAAGRAAARQAVGLYTAAGGGAAGRAAVTGARGGGAYGGGYAGVSGPLAATDSGAARKHIEGYLGKSITDREYDMLMRATHAESGGRNSPEEQAMIMGSILNRARTRGGIEATLMAKNQFQAVTGTRYAPGPSAAYRAGPGGARLTSIQSASQLLARVPTTQVNFTAASAAAYGAGTNIGYLGQLRRTGGAVYGGTQFTSGLLPGAGGGGLAGGAGATAEWPTATGPVVGGGRVVEEQGRVAGTRKMALAAQTRGWLERAAAETGVEVRVFSGGQPAIGTSYARTGSTRHDLGGAADIKLYRNGRVLDAGNPEDLAIMQRFTAASVAAGATGVGAGYMGTGAHRRQAIHIGGGQTAAWGTGWARGALEAGLARRRAGNIPRMPEPPKPVTVAVATKDAEEKQQQQKEDEDKQEREALTKKTEEKKKEREALTEPAPKETMDKAKSAGKAAAAAFKEGIKDTKIPIDLDKDKNREKPPADRAMKEAA